MTHLLYDRDTTLVRHDLNNNIEGTDNLPIHAESTQSNQPSKQAGHFSDIDLGDHNDTQELEADYVHVTTANLQPDNGSLRATHEASDVESDEEYARQIRDGKSAASTKDQQQPRTPKAGGYDSRIEQILYENPKLPILIVDAGRSAENGGKYIVYTIRTGVCFSSKERSEQKD